MNQLLANYMKEELSFFARHGAVWHLKTSQIAARLNVPEESIRQSLITMATWGFISLRTWSNQAWREVSYSECPTPNFFFNSDDGCYVRVKPLLSF
jgi:hypothetical protein